METLDKQLPQSKDSEELVLGSIMSRSAYDEIGDLISEDCFYCDMNKQIYVAIKSIIEKGDYPDMVMVANKLPSELMHSVVSIAQRHTPDVYQHALHIKEKAMLRKMIMVSRQAEIECFAENDIHDILSKANDGFNSIIENVNTEVQTIVDALDIMRENMTKNATQGNKITGFATGFDELDKRSGGLQKGDLITIAAESSQGKTSLALSMCRNMILEGTKIAFYSLEMQSVQLASRLASIESGIPSNQILYSQLTYDEFYQIDKSLARISKSHLYIDERSTTSLDSVLTSIRSMKAKFDIDGVVVDYLQILPQNEKGKNDEQLLAIASRKLKNIAKDLKIFVIAISQLSRDNQNPKPTLSRLRGSGQIVEASDIVMLVYRPEYYNKGYQDDFTDVNPKGTALIDVAKGRNIGVFKFILGFDKERTYFYELDSIPRNTFENKQLEPF